MAPGPHTALLEPINKNNMPDVSELTYEEVRAWILANSDDAQAMDDINKLTYVFTSKYKERESLPPRS
jgi:hypothetical protein